MSDALGMIVEQREAREAGAERMKQREGGSKTMEITRAGHVGLCGSGEHTHLPGVKGAGRGWPAGGEAI